MNAADSVPNVSDPKSPGRDRLRVAFFGGGIDSAVGEVHRIAVEMDRRFQLVAGCFSADSQVNAESMLHYDVPRNRTYNSLATLLDKESGNIDALVVLTPTPRHKADVITCLEARVPVICEKSLATSSVDAVEIRDVLAEHAGFLAVTFNYSGYPMLRELKHMIQNGRLGRLTQIHIEMPQEGFARFDSQGHRPVPQQWRLHDTELPVIALDLGVHVHHTVRFLTGQQPVKVMAVNNSFGHFSDIVDNTICIAKYSDDMVCSVWYSKTALGHRNGLRLRVFGEIGSAEWYQFEPETLYCYDNRGTRTQIDRASGDVSISPQRRYNRFKAGHPAGFIEAFANLYCDIADSLIQYLQTGRTSYGEYVFGVEDALEGLQMLTAMKESAETESWVSL